MNRCAKGFRVVSGLLMLLNIGAFFLPVTQRLQENYATLKWSCFDYLVFFFKEQSLPHGTEVAVSISTMQIIVMFGLMVLPVGLSLFMGIFGIVGDSKQKVTSIFSFVIAGLYIGLFLAISSMWSVPVNGQVYEKGLGLFISLGVSVVCSVTSIVALVTTQGKEKMISREIPRVSEIRQEQVQAKYNIILDNEKPMDAESQQEAQMQPQGMVQQPTEIPQETTYVPGEPRGVLVGITGMYAGAEIPFAHDESIKLGRLADNDLIFENQPKVSRNHCQIKWDATRKKFSYLDYSSNGSFVEGHEDCLPQNIEIWLPVGTVVAIGDETNTFRLE